MWHSPPQAPRRAKSRSSAPSPSRRHVTGPLPLLSSANPCRLTEAVRGLTVLASGELLFLSKEAATTESYSLSLRGALPITDMGHRLAKTLSVA